MAYIKSGDERIRKDMLAIDTTKIGDYLFVIPPPPFEYPQNIHTNNEWSSYHTGYIIPELKKMPEMTMYNIRLENISSDLKKIFEKKKNPLF